MMKKTIPLLLLSIGFSCPAFAQGPQNESWYIGLGVLLTEHLAPKVEEFGKGVIYPNGGRLQVLWSLSNSDAIGVSRAMTIAPVYTTGNTGVTYRRGFSGRQYMTWFGALEGGVRDVKNTGSASIKGVGGKYDTGIGPYIGVSFGRNFLLGEGSGLDLNLQYFFATIGGLRYHSAGLAIGILW